MKTTKTHFKQYKGEVIEWCEILQVVGWKIYFTYELLEDSYANVITNYQGRTATFFFSTNWENCTDLDDGIIGEVAKHEVIHLLLAPLSELGYSRFTSSDEIGTAEEDLVHRLEVLIPNKGK